MDPKLSELFILEKWKVTYVLNLLVLTETSTNQLNLTRQYSSDSFLGGLTNLVILSLAVSEDTSELSPAF